MMKYLLLFAFLVAVWLMWSKRHLSRGGASSESREAASEKMVACVHCGVLFPESEAIVDGDRFYCSESHRLAARSAER